MNAASMQIDGRRRLAELRITEHRSLDPKLQAIP